MVIGLTGKYCSGKSSLVPFFEEWGAQSLNMDQLGHQALEANHGRILEAFGPEVLGAGEGGQTRIDRRALGRIVFSGIPGLLRLWRAISHPWMVQRTREILEEGQTRHWLIDAALLFPMKLDQFCDIAFYIHAPFWTRLKRGLSRDKRGFFSTLQRMWSQEKILPQPSSQHTDVYKVGNLGPLVETWAQIRKILERTLEAGA
jgi:dephospho-CoA kinase